MYIACPLTANELKVINPLGRRREFPCNWRKTSPFMLPHHFCGNTPAGVEMVINAKDNLHIVHMLNNYLTGHISTTGEDC